MRAQLSTKAKVKSIYPATSVILSTCSQMLVLLQNTHINIVNTGEKLTENPSVVNTYININDEISGIG